jgi:hypothetical protein
VEEVEKFTCFVGESGLQLSLELEKKRIGLRKRACEGNWQVLIKR